MEKQNQEFFERLSALRIVPVVALQDARLAVPLADSLLAAGLTIIEVTFRTAAAAEAIRAIKRERPAMMVGAGTLLSLDNLSAARAAGAQFGVAPGLNREIVREAAKLELPFIPGVATPTEIERALAHGCQTLKLFPAGPLGGVEMIIALAGPYGHTGISFVPTGGINPSNLESYLRCNSVAAVGGTWLAKPVDLVSGNWTEITDRSRRALRIVQATRASL